MRNGEKQRTNDLNFMTANLVFLAQIEDQLFHFDKFDPDFMFSDEN